MKANPVQGVQPSVLRWARETVGLDVEEVATRLNRNTEEIVAWEQGSAAPSYPQLEKLAYTVYKRPIALFFLPAPPQESTPKAEFRTLPSADMDQLLPDTILHIRKAHAFQLALGEIFENKSPFDKNIWKDIVVSEESEVSDVVNRVRQYLGVDIGLQSTWRDPEKSLKAWRELIEEKGVFVFKDSFKQKEISGFCLADDQLPIIYLNNSTTKTRQTFSLIHELCHLLVQENGLSKFNQNYLEELPQDIQALEKLCNRLAAAILIPPEDFFKQSKNFPRNVEDVAEYELVNLACRYGVSREAILRRFLDQDRVSSSFYEQKAGEWAAQQTKSKGGDWYATTNTYLSERFTAEVVSLHYRNQLPLERAADLLGINAKNFEGLEQRILRGTSV